MESLKCVPITWQNLNSILKKTNTTDSKQMTENIILPSLIFSKEITNNLFEKRWKGGKIETTRGKKAALIHYKSQLIHTWSSSICKLNYEPLCSEDIDSLYDKKKCSELHRKIVEKLQDSTKRNQFIQGANYELSLLFLELFVNCAQKKGYTSDTVVFTPFNKYAGITIAVKNTWSEFIGSDRRSPEYKEKKAFVKNLSKNSPRISFSFNGNSFDLLDIFNSISTEDLDVQYAVMSIMASTWAVWEYIYEKSQICNLDEADEETKSVCDKLKNLYDAIVPQQITWATLFLKSSLSLTKSEYIEKFLLPALKTCITKFENPITEEDDLWKKWFIFKPSGDRNQSHLFNGKQKNLSTDYLSIMTDSSIAKDCLSGGLVSYNDYLYLNEVKKAWELYTKGNAIRTANIESLITSLYSIVNNEHWIVRFNINNQFIDLREKLLSIKDAPGTIYKIAVFSIIATTWATWMYCNDIYATPQNEINTPTNKLENFSKKQSDINSCRINLKNLCSMIFPNPTPSDETNAMINTDSYSSETPDELLKGALIAIENDNGLKAVENLTNLVTNYTSLASAKTLAHAYKALNKCKERNWKLPAHLSNVNQNDLVAQRYGAITTCNINHNILPEVKASVSKEGGYYYLNAGDDEAVSKYVQLTKPQNWYPFSDWLNANSVKLPESNLKGILVGQSNILSNNLRFIFVEPDYDNNIANALNTLDIFKKLIDNAISEPSDWGTIEIIIRCNQEQSTPLLDTAYSFLDESSDGTDSVFVNNPIKLYLLDEEKRTADLLYAQHPLFYPLTSVRNQHNLDNKTYNLVIISDNPNIDSTIWLIRQAFWLLPHTRYEIRSKITVLSPIAEDLCCKTTSLCPAFAAFSKKPNGKPLEIDLKRNVYIDDIHFPEIEYHTISLDNFEIQNKIAEYSNNDILYYVVNLSDDLKGINLATQIRELSIKKALQQRKLNNYTSDETVIAVKCSNNKYANLVTQLIIPKEEEYDNRWFNDYKLIPFGIKSDIFSWDELVGGKIEFMSECMHYQYCTDPFEQYNYKTPAPDEFVWSYYRRLYNRISSYSAAMSLPYRLFEVGVVLPAWSFNNKDSYWSQENLEELADRMDDTLNSNTLDALSKWEHSRWCCFLYSNGWLPSTIEETKHYITNGVTRHSLQIAKLHPCLCSWDNLISLYSALHKAYLGTEDSFGNQITNEKFHGFSGDDYEFFQELDTDNISQTGDILRARPLPRQKQIIH